MDRGLVTLIGMSIAYVASLAGLGLAWWAWRRRRKGDVFQKRDSGTPSNDERSSAD